MNRGPRTLRSGGDAGLSDAASQPGRCRSTRGSDSPRARHSDRAALPRWPAERLRAASRHLARCRLRRRAGGLRAEPRARRALLRGAVHDRCARRRSRTRRSCSIRAGRGNHDQHGRADARGRGEPRRRPASSSSATSRAGDEAPVLPAAAGQPDERRPSLAGRGPLRRRHVARVTSTARSRCVPDGHRPPRQSSRSCSSCS